MDARGSSTIAGLGVLLFLLAPSAAQTPLLIVNGTLPSFGTDADAIGDWDGDGTGDIAIGIPGGYSFSMTPGLVRIHSGRDGTLLAELSGSTPMQRFGTFVAGVGDMDADGAIDVAVGSVPGTFFGLPPAVQVVSSATGTMLLDQTLPVLGLGALDAAGDVNADGHADIVKSGLECPGGFGTNGPGDVTVYSGASGGVLYVWCGDTLGDHLGWSLAAAGDVNADGYADIVAGATEHEDYTPNSLGYVRAFSGFDGAVIHNWEGPLGTYTGYGETVDGAGDINGDGYADVIAGARQEIVDGVWLGSAFVYSGFDGSLLHHVLGQFHFVQFGFKVAGPGDIDGDGYADFVVATSQVQALGAPQVGYQLYSGADATLMAVVPVDLSSESFLSVLRAAGDLNVDGTPDLIVTTKEPTSVRVLSGAPVLFEDLGFALAGSQGTPHLEIEGVLMRQLPLALSVTGAPPLAPLYLVLGDSSAPVPFHGGTLVPLPQIVVAGLVTDADGKFALETTMPASPPSGTQVFVQGWLPDAGAPTNWAATNAVLGVAP